LAFTTIQGSGANDATSFVGTSGVDNIAIVNLSTPAFLGAQGDNDGISWNNFIRDEGYVTAFQLKGGQGNDTFTAGALTLNSFVNGNAGNDTFGGAGGYTVSTVFGGQGNDTFATGALNGTKINGNIGNDTINATGSASSSIYGGQGLDVLNVSGTHASSVIQADKDNDTINVGGGVGVLDAIANSTINGNAGNDRINYNLAANTPPTAADTFATSTIFGGQGNDILASTAAGNLVGVTLSGDDGNDTVSGAGGQDNIFGGTGNDLLTGLNGGDSITSGAGIDTIQYAAAGETFAGAVASGVTVLTPGIDRVLDATVGDIINYTFTTYTSAAAGPAAAGVLNTAVTAAQADNSVALIRGNFNATTGIFTNSATGTDTLFSIDTNSAAAGAVAFESIVLVGAVFNAANIAATATSNVTVTLA
jgi:Ca2+-binding RTX toxin-like protein